MTLSSFIVHRSNSPQNMQTPVEQVAYYVAQGFTKVEVDIYAITETTYKFCHPLDKDKVTEIHELHDGFLNELIGTFPHTTWFVDLKSLDLDEMPKAMINYLIEAFNNSGIFISAQKEILEYIHRQGMRTGQYFRIGEDAKLDYKPDFYLQNATEDLRYPKLKTIFCSTDLGIATEHLTYDFAGIMVDGNLLIP